MILVLLLLTSCGSGQVVVTPDRLDASVRYLTDAYHFLEFVNQGDTAVELSFNVPEISKRPHTNAMFSEEDQTASVALLAPKPIVEDHRSEHLSVTRWQSDHLADYHGIENIKSFPKGTVLKTSNEFGFDDLVRLRDITAFSPQTTDAAMDSSKLQASSGTVTSRTPEVSDYFHDDPVSFDLWNRTMGLSDLGYALDLEHLVGKRKLSDSRANGHLRMWVSHVARKIVTESTRRLLVGRRKGVAKRKLHANPQISSVSEVESLHLLIIEFRNDVLVGDVEEVLQELASYSDSFTYIEPDSKVWLTEASAKGHVRAEQTCPQIRADRSEAFVNELYSSMFHFADSEPTSESARLAKPPNDPLWSVQWGPQFAHAEGAWMSHSGAEQGGKEVIVCVVDTGVDYKHPDLAENMWVNEAELNGLPGVDDDGNGYVDDIYGINALRTPDDPRAGDPLDDNSHGSHCAGVIGAAANNALGIAGVNRKVKIMACKFLGSDGGGAVSNAVRCIDYAIQKGVRVLSNSWGGSGSRSLREAAFRSQESGVLFVAAAGNQFQNNDIIPTYPANYGGEMDNVVSVASIDQRGLSSFSNYGRRTVHVAAPGSNILSTVRNGAYATLSGTSMACPAIAGLLSLILSANPLMDYRDAIAALHAGVTVTEDLATKTIWGGYADFDATLEAVLGRKVIRPVPSWAPWLGSPLKLAARESFKLPFAVYGLIAGDVSSSIEVWVTDTETRAVTQRLTIPWSVSVTPRPQLDVDNLPKELTLPTEPGVPSLPVSLDLKHLNPAGTAPLNITLRLASSSDPTWLVSNFKLDGTSTVVVQPDSVTSLLFQCLRGPSEHVVEIIRDEGLDELVRSNVRVICQDFEVRVGPEVIGSEGDDLHLTIVSSCQNDFRCTPPPASFLAHYVSASAPSVKAFKPRIWPSGLFWADLRECSSCFLVGNATNATLKAVALADEGSGLTWSDATPDDDDDGTTAYQLQRMKTFPFFNKEFTSVFINANGWVSFTNRTAASSWEPRLHVDDDALDAIAVYWTDLRNAHILVGESEDEIIIQWTDCELFNDIKHQKFSLQLILTRSGNVFMSYKNLVYEASAQIGLKVAERGGSVTPTTVYRRIAPLDRLYGYLVGKALLAYSPVPTETTDASSVSFASSDAGYAVGVLRQNVTALSIKREPNVAGYIKILTSSPIVQQPLRVRRVDISSSLDNRDSPNPMQSTQN